MLVFTTNEDDLRVVAKNVEVIAELFASSLKRTSLCNNKKECFLEFTKDNQINWCKRNLNKSNIHLVTDATIINETLNNHSI